MSGSRVHLMGQSLFAEGRGSMVGRASRHAHHGSQEQSLPPAGRRLMGQGTGEAKI